jgi:NAD(P)H dehydrogenase (quinone)
MTLLIIDGHPDRGTLTAALASAYRQGAAGADTRVLELASLRFDPILRRGGQPLEPDLLEARAALLAARHVAWFFPTWWAGPPALVKGFIDRTFTPGFAYRQVPGRALHERLLRGRSARLVTTMDAPWWWYSAMYQRALHAAFSNATLRFVGFSVRSTTLYGVRTQSRAQLTRALERMEAIGARDAAALRAPTALTTGEPTARTRLRSLPPHPESAADRTP